MGTAIVVAIVSGLVSIASVVANYRITRKNSVEETTRAREAREAEDVRAAASRDAEDRRLRADRDTEAQRRKDQQQVERDAAAAAAQAAKVEQRWEAVRTIIETEARVKSDPFVHKDNYRLRLQGLSLLTHPQEANLRNALLMRGALTVPPELVDRVLSPAWWHPWVSEWAANPSTPMLNGDADEGRVF